MNNETLSGMGTEAESLCLKAQGLDDPDMARLAVFLRVGSERLRHRWHLAGDEQADALLLCNGETVPMVGSDLQGGGAVTLRLVEARSFDGEPGQLCMPLAFDALMEQLSWAEDRLSRAAATGASTVVLPVDTAQAAAQGEHEPKYSVDSTDADAALRPGDFYHLDRLPASSALGSDRRVLAIASLLTLRAVQLEELVAKSGLSEPDCESALLRLKALGALRVIVATPTPVRERRRGGAQRTEPLVQAPEATGGVLARWRGRLGLGGR